MLVLSALIVPGFDHFFIFLLILIIYYKKIITK